jgi:hypothetical protein
MICESFAAVSLSQPRSDTDIVRGNDTNMSAWKQAFTEESDMRAQTISQQGGHSDWPLNDVNSTHESSLSYAPPGLRNAVYRPNIGSDQHTGRPGMHDLVHGALRGQHHSFFPPPSASESRANAARDSSDWHHAGTAAFGGSHHDHEPKQGPATQTQEAQRVNMQPQVGVLRQSNPRVLLSYAKAAAFPEAHSEGTQEAQMQEWQVACARADVCACVLLRVQKHLYAFMHVFIYVLCMYICMHMHTCFFSVVTRLDTSYLKPKQALMLSLKTP